MAVSSLGITASARWTAATETQLRLPNAVNCVLSTPDHTAFAVTDVDASWFGSLDDPTQADMAVIGQWSTVSLQRSWGLRITHAPTLLQLRLWTSTDGSTSVSTPDNLALLTLSPGQYFGVRGTRRQSDGMVRLYYSSVDPPSWTLLGSAAVNAGVAVLNSTAAMLVGGYGAAAGTAGHFAGYFRHGEVRNGYDGAGTVIASPDVRAVVDTATGFTDSVGKVWTVGGTADLVTRTKP